MKAEVKKNIISLGVAAVAVLVFGGVTMSAAGIHGADSDDALTQVQQSKKGQSEESEKERVVTEIKKEVIKFKSKTIDDDTLEYSQTEIRTKGEDGEKTYTYSVTYKGDKEVSRKLIKEEITKQPVDQVIAKGTKIIWRCQDVTSFDRNPNNDNLCINSKGDRRYVGDCEAVKLDSSYSPGQYGASRYNGCAR